MVVTVVMRQVGTVAILHPGQAIPLVSQHLPEQASLPANPNKDLRVTSRPQGTEGPHPSPATVCLVTEPPEHSNHCLKATHRLQLREVTVLLVTVRLRLHPARPLSATLSLGDRPRCTVSPTVQPQVLPSNSTVSTGWPYLTPSLSYRI